MTQILQRSAPEQLDVGGRVRRNFSITGFEMRASTTDSNILHFSGYATIYGHGYDMYGGPAEGGWTEYVDQGACRKTLAERCDVAFLLNHGGLTLARTKPGTLRLAEDTQGLAVDADLDRRVSAVSDLELLIASGALDEMSMAFTTLRQVWLNADGEEVPWWDMSGIERHLREISLNKGDVSVVNYGANDATSATFRAFEALMTGRGSSSELDMVRARIEALSAKPQSTPDPAEGAEDRATQPEGMSLALARAYVATDRVPA